MAVLRIDPGLDTFHQVTLKKATLFLADISCFIWHSKFDLLDGICRQDDALGIGQLSTASFWLPDRTYTDWVDRLAGPPGQLPHHTLLVALLFIFRLRSIHPFVQASKGSEYRVLATALMLANKYMEDEPVSNSEWQRRTMIPLEDLCIMEAEFLSNAGFGLYISADQWHEWLVVLRRISRFYDRMVQMKLASTISSQIGGGVAGHPNTPHAGVGPSHVGLSSSLEGQLARKPDRLADKTVMGSLHGCAEDISALMSMTTTPGLTMAVSSANSADFFHFDHSLTSTFSHLAEPHPGLDGAEYLLSEEDANVYSQLSAFIAPDGPADAALSLAAPPANGTVGFECSPAEMDSLVAAIGPLNRMMAGKTGPARSATPPSVGLADTTSPFCIVKMKEVTPDRLSVDSTGTAGMSQLGPGSGSQVSPCSSLPSEWADMQCKDAVDGVDGREWHVGAVSGTENPVF